MPVVPPVLPFTGLKLPLFLDKKLGWLEIISSLKIIGILLKSSNVLIDFQDHDIALDYCQTPSVLHNFKLNP